MAVEAENPVSREDVRRRTMSGTRPLGRSGLALAIVVPLLLGVVGGGVWGYLAHSPAGGSSVPGQPVSFALKAASSGMAMFFVGVGGSIDGLKNPTLSVNQGDIVTITVQNGDVATHNLYIDGYDVQAPDAAPGASTSLQFTASKQGTFAYFCAIPGHRAMGMEGKLVVGSGQGGAAGLPPIGPENLPLSTQFIGRDPNDVPPPTNRTTSAIVHVWLDARVVNAEIQSGASFQYWTYNGTVPGPMFRVRVNDTVVVHFHNSDPALAHSVDFHAATGPGGGMAASMSDPGEWGNFSFKAIIPGLFVYHCGTPNVPTHVSMGMYGMILVEPGQGLPYFNGQGKPIKEFYVVQGELYTKWPAGTIGNQLFDGARLLDENPTFVVFNGRWQALTGNHSLFAKVNDTVRIYFGVGGPNLISSFHIIGEMFDKVYFLGDLTDPPLSGIQTVPVDPGSATLVELTLQVPGNYVLVDHSLTRALDKGALGILNVTGPSNPAIFEPLP